MKIALYTSFLYRIIILYLQFTEFFYLIIYNSRENIERVDHMVLQLGAFVFVVIAAMLAVLNVDHMTHLI